MIEHKEENKYSLKKETYGINKIEWKKIKEDVLSNELNSKVVSSKYKFLYNSTTKEDDSFLENKRLWFLYDTLLQEKYNHLYKREKLVNPQACDFVYCDYPDFGRGMIRHFSLDGSIMVIKFDKRPLNTFCDAKLMCTNFDDVKRKITKL